MFPAPRLLDRPGYVPAAGEPIWADPVMFTAMPTVSDARQAPDQAAAALVLLDRRGTRSPRWTRYRPEPCRTRV